MPSIWPALCWATVASAKMLNMAFYSAELDDTLVVGEMPNAGIAREPSPLRVVDTVMELKRGGGQSISAQYVQAIRAAAMREAGIERASSGVSPLTSISGSIFTAPITVGGSSFQVVVDTGSSDPWLATTTFTCVDPQSGMQEYQSSCDFGPLYDPSSSSTYSTIANENFNVSYADGENLNGVMGYETFSIAGITVPQQEFGVVTQAAWYGDGTSSGLVGFAYSSLTSAYTGANASADVRGRQMSYPTLFTSIYQRSLAAPIFSLALSRSSSTGGLIAIGGIPNIQHSPAFATTPIQPVGINATSKQLVYQFYSINIDGWAFSSSQSAQFDVAGTGNPKKTALVGNGTSLIVDSGTSLIYAPNSVAASVAAAFNPPAVWDNYQESYVVSCSAVPPLFGVSIASKIFYVNPLDMLVPGADYGNCFTGVQPNMGGLTILGDVWMKNVLVVFDLGAEQMRFAAREFYDTPACSGTNCVGTS